MTRNHNAMLQDFLKKKIFYCIAIVNVDVTNDGEGVIEMEGV